MPAGRLKQCLHFAWQQSRQHGLRQTLLFAAIALSLWGFGELAESIYSGEVIPFDRPLLEWMAANHTPARDALMLFFSWLGYQYGVIPVDVLLVLLLAVKRRWPEGWFAGLSLAGSALLNMAAKHYFARPRPALWASIAPEATYSFPSGHAMGSMTLAVVLVLLAWRSRMRWPVIATMLVFVPMVAISRVYLGVHYPSDVLAGWAAALAWVIGGYWLIFGRSRRPWQ
ncbi:MAG: phosphatase PAP2 family protein [Pseudomonadota bacterium]|nr:phosphatase PAP2 family protein [Pseudomonadota bacterium]